MMMDEDDAVTQSEKVSGHRRDGVGGIEPAMRPRGSSRKRAKRADVPVVPGYTNCTKVDSLRSS